MTLYVVAPTSVDLTRPDGVLSTPEPMPVEGLPQWWRCAGCEQRWLGRPLYGGGRHICTAGRHDGPLPATVLVWREVTPPADEGACIGGDYCGRTTNGWFTGGSHGPGWYCGWCEAIPDGYAKGWGAIVATATVPEGSHHANECFRERSKNLTRYSQHGYCHPDALPDSFHTPYVDLKPLAGPIPCERPKDFICKSCGSDARKGIDLKRVSECERHSYSRPSWWPAPADVVERLAAVAP